MKFFSTHDLMVLNQRRSKISNFEVYQNHRIHQMSIVSETFNPNVSITVLSQNKQEGAFHCNTITGKNPAREFERFRRLPITTLVLINGHIVKIREALCNERRGL